MAGSSRASGTSSSTPPLTACGGASLDLPAASPLRRLSRFELNNTLRDLLSDMTAPADRLPAETIVDGFDNNAEVAVPSPLLIEGYVNMAQDVSGRAVANLRAILPCDPARDGELACGQKLIASFGRRAFRRPLDAGETARLGRLFSSAHAAYGFSAAIQMVLKAMLLSPAFLYRLELAPSARPTDVVARLTSFEVATRLSYFLWGSTPDDRLLQLAETGRLGKREEIEAEARRLLADPRARRVVAHFHAGWLGLEGIDELEKNTAVFSAWKPRRTSALMRKEIDLFLESSFWQGPGDVATLFTEPRTALNAELATFYGLRGPRGDAFEPVELDPSQRAGLLTQGALLALNAKPDQTSPVMRGHFIRERILCTPPPPPPPNAMVVAPDLDPKLTTRERFTQHGADPACASCHRLMDPVGLSLESFDGVGRFRSTENGKPIDASGELVGSDVAGPLVGAVELGRKLGGSADVKACVATQWFRFAFGRDAQSEDRCTLAVAGKTFAAAGSNLPELLVAFTQTNAFLYRRLQASN